MATVVNTKYRHKFLAQIIFKAETPIVIGSGNKSFLTDVEILKDFNGLPYIPGTTLAGILRHAYESKVTGSNLAKDIFGFQNPFKSKDGEGSRIVFSDGKLVGKIGTDTDFIVDVIDSYCNINNEFCYHYKELPIRQHCSINDKGVVKNTGKFDEEVIYKGSKFCFEVEMSADKAESLDDFKTILQCLYSDSFRIGGGTRKGFGEIIVDEPIKFQDIDLHSKIDSYLDKKSKMTLADEFWNNCDIIKNPNDESEFVKYRLEISPEDFFCFGSGFGDLVVDKIPVTEGEVVWQNNIPTFESGFDEKEGNKNGDMDIPAPKVIKKVLIPSTSVKGAIRHRTAFHYNKIKMKKGENDLKIADENDAVMELFGDVKSKKRGNVIFSDVIQNCSLENKILNHVKIDRFTGGAMTGALFSEKTLYCKEENYKFELNILVKKGFNQDFINAFESSLKDICSGMLPLGGGINRGNGCFSGTAYERINNKYIEFYPTDKREKLWN